MRQFYSILKKTTLFKNIDESELGEVLKNLHAYFKQFSKHDIIRYSETEVTEIGIVAEGTVYLTKTDIYGNRTILAELLPSKTFGESLAFTRAENSPIIVSAATDATVIFISAEGLINKGILTCEQHGRMIENLLTMLAERIFVLQMKNDILSQKTTRDKLLMYFEYESKTAGSKTFNIHFSREELAEFLCLNTSAMSRELGKMRDEGMLVYDKNCFKLKT